MVLLAVNESRTPVTTSSYFGKPAPLLAYPLRIHKYYVKITIHHIDQLVITNKKIFCVLLGGAGQNIVRGVKIPLRYIDPGSKYRTIYWPRGQYIGGSKYCLTPAPWELNNDSHAPRSGQRHSTIKDTHFGGVITSTISSQITSLTIVYSTVYSDADQK